MSKKRGEKIKKEKNKRDEKKKKKINARMNFS